MELNTSSSFKTNWSSTAMADIVQDILQMLDNTRHWEGIYYSLHHPTTSIPYPRFTKLIIGRCKDKVGMRIPAWMILEEIKHTEHYRMYAKVFGIDVPMTQSQLTGSTQGTHRTPSTLRSPNLKQDIGESSASKRLTVIRFHIPQRRSTYLTPPAPVPTVDKANEIILQDTLQVSLAEHQSRLEQEAKENVEMVNKHLASEEIEKMVEKLENVVDDSLPSRNDDQNIPGPRLEPRSDKESPEVEVTKDAEVEIPNDVIHVNVNDDEENEMTDEVYELKRREKGKIVEESWSTPSPTTIRSLRIHTNLVSSDTEKLQELTITATTPSYPPPAVFYHSSKPNLLSFDKLADRLQDVMADALPTMVDTHIKKQVEKQVLEQVKVHVPMYVGEGLILERQQTKEESDKMIAKAILQEPQPQVSSVPEQQYQLYLSMKNNPQLQQQDIAIWLALQMKFETSQVAQTTCKTLAVRLRDQDDPYDDAHLEGENSAKRQKTSEYEVHVIGESFGQGNNSEPGPSSSGNQEQVDDYDFWTESYAIDDDEIPIKQVSQDIMEEVSLTIDEAELKKLADEMLRQRCTSGDEHQYHIDQMKNFLKNPEAPALSLINQDLLYLKKGNSGPKKIVLSLYKFPAIIFNDNDIEEQESSCEDRLHKDAERAWKTKGIEIVARRANKCIVLITVPNYKNLNKNDIEDMYLLIMNGKVPDFADTGLLWSLSIFIRSSVIWERVHDFQLGIESYQQKVNLTAPTISFLGIEEYRMFTIIYDPVHGIIYKNSKKEKRVMRHSEIHKFCDATLTRVLEGLKSYNNDYTKRSN
ncbi:hypothetical protein Tco_1030490 [Tanacetum coccineum]|uniref:Uncharacterized protein n=1 Tax=Tanacetum coccineum TaxID=301880 RepID=A0ABQ5G723_9ASTR